GVLQDFNRFYIIHIDIAKATPRKPVDHHKRVVARGNGSRAPDPYNWRSTRRAPVGRDIYTRHASDKGGFGPSGGNLIQFVIFYFRNGRGNGAFFDGSISDYYHFVKLRKIWLKADIDLGPISYRDFLAVITDK